MKLVLLDCDGTLVDSQQAIVLAFNAAWRAAGLDEPDSQTVRRLVGTPLTEAIGVLLPGADDWFVRRLAGLYRDAYYGGHQHPEHDDEPLFPGVREALQAMRGAGLLMGVATGKSFRGLTALLERHGIADWFATLQTADRVLGKPNPDMVYRAQEEIGLESRDIVVVGDTSHDIEMALRAGVGAVGVAWGYHSVHDLQKAGARRIAGCREELPRMVFDALGISR